MLNRQLGKYGEDLAAKWLKKNGYEILLRNWRFGRVEIDIVASRESMIHVIEVKTRKTTTFGFPEQSVSIAKQKNILIACTALVAAKQYPALQVDILSILLSNATPQYLLIENICGYTQ
jgi:putative endonuclease